MSGYLPSAAEKLEKAIEVFELIGDAQLALLRCNLAIVRLDLGQRTEAVKELDRALSNAIEVDREPLRFAVQTVRLRALAEAHRYVALDEALSACESLMATLRHGERDSRDSAQRASELLEAAGEHERASRARAIAEDQQAKLRS